MQQANLNNKIDNFCNELEVLSSKMVEFFSIGNYSQIRSIDLKRKFILEEISKDLDSLSNSNKKKLELVWVNNKKIIKQFDEKMQEDRKSIINKKKLFTAYTNNSG